MKKVNEILAGLRTKTMDYCDLLCFLCENGSDGWDWDLLLIKLSDYVRFYQSSNDEEDMKMQVVDTERIYNNGIDGIDVYNEENFVSATINDRENEMILRLRNNQNKISAYVLAIA